MKILELTTFSAGICGVFARVKEESIRLSELGHEVRIFSSNFVKGTDQIAPAEEKIQNVIVKRFPARKLGGESFMSWNFEEDARAFSPDVIIAHGYRHTHTSRALKLGKKLNCKVFLVTHAPFIEGNSTRSPLAKMVVGFYDSFIGPRKLKQFNKVIAISRWEIPILKSLGVVEEKIVYIPNGIPREFFTQKKSTEEKKILFLGRIAPIKDLETLIKAIPLLKDKSAKVEIVGPAEEAYLAQLKSLISSLKLENRVIFSPPVFDLKQKIAKLDSAAVFVLPSKSEAMPQALIEAMARERIAIASNNRGSRDLVTDGKTGYLFPIGDSQALAQKLDLVLSSDQSKVRAAARKSVEQFEWNKIVKKIQETIS